MSRCDRPVAINRAKTASAPHNPPQLPQQGAASSAHARRLLLGALLAGLPVLVPSLIVLYRVFKVPPRPREAD